jgi:DNA-binding CsgD family transcriptional regulator
MQARRIAEQPGGSGADLVRTYVNLSAMLLYSTGRYEEAGRVAVEGLALARRLGVIRSYGAMLAAFAADAFLHLGRWSEADSLTSEADLFESPPAVSLPLHLVRAALELRRGRLDAAGRLVDIADRLSATMPDPQNRGNFHVRQAELAVWERRYDDARRAVEDGLGIVGGSDDDRFGPELCALGLRAEADRRATSRDRPGDGARARQVASGLKAEVRKITRTPLEWGLMPAPDAAAFAVVCDAEYARIDGCSDPELWAAAVACWEGLGQPYDAAYAHWREAEALLAGHESRKRAGTTLNRAHQVAVQLGAAPLLTEIEDLAIRGRIELGVAVTEPAKPDSAESFAAPLGLTRREAEVLVLLASGHTNRQIAQSMFISEKTASVHVTNILRKLGVTSRVEAGAVGQRRLKEHPPEAAPAD